MRIHEIIGSASLGMLGATFQWVKPNLEYEWQEIVDPDQRPDLRRLYHRLFPSFKDFQTKAAQGQRIRIDGLQLDNSDDTTADILPEKLDRVQEQYQDGVVEMPLVVSVNGSYVLIGGNTRLNVGREMGIPVYGWAIKAGQEMFGESDQMNDGIPKRQVSLKELRRLINAGLRRKGLFTLYDMDGHPTAEEIFYDGEPVTIVAIETAGASNRVHSVRFFGGNKIRELVTFWAEPILIDDAAGHKMLGEADITRFGISHRPCSIRLIEDDMSQDMLRIHNSVRPIATFTKRSYAQRVGRKPHGLWWSMGQQWHSFVSDKLPKGKSVGQFNYGVKIAPTTKMVTLSDWDSILAFTISFGVTRASAGVFFWQSGDQANYDPKQDEMLSKQNRCRVPAIDWTKVAASYDAIELPNYRKNDPSRPSVEWLDVDWDVPSGCAWNLDSISLKKL